jgi:hypothetical protein
MATGCRRRLLMIGALAMAPGELVSLPGAVRVGRAGELLASFDFAGRTGQHSYPCVSPAQQTKFQQDFREQLASIQATLSGYKDRDGNPWLPLDAALPQRMTSGPYQPRSDFHIFVSEVYPKSRALVPAWLGQRGWMEFPAHRVVAREAGIAHEIVHVLFPNGNRMLAEGLAVYLQNKLFPYVPVYPHFGDRLESLVAEFLRTNFRSSAHLALWSIDLDALERISTPDKFRLRLGRKPLLGARPGNPDPPADEIKIIYAIAGSLVELLMDNLIGDDLFTPENFGALYKSTPLRPLERDSGDPDRWRSFYLADGRSYSFTDIGLLWKTYMHFVLFGGQARGEFPIPTGFAKSPLVSGLYEKLNALTGRPSAGGRRSPRQRAHPRKLPNRISAPRPRRPARADGRTARIQPNR